MSSTTHIHLNGGGEHTVRYLTTHRSEPFVSVQVSRDPAARFDVFVTSEAQADALIVAFIQAKKLLTGEPGHVAISEHTATPRAVPAAKCWHPATCSEFGHEHPHIDDAVTPPGQAAPPGSESWTCGGCGGTFTGRRPAGDRCPACQPAAAFRYDGTNYELLGNEDYDALGFPEDDPFLTILRRKSDGQLFDVAIEVTALPVEPPTPPSQVIPGQLALPEVSP